MRDRVHVVIPTIPARRAWLEELRAAIDQQTYQPHRITVIEDREKHGPSSRWFVEVDPDTIVVTLDDDVLIGPDYIEKSVAWLNAYDAVITWWPLSQEELVVHAPGVELHSVAGGFTVFRAKWLDELRREARYSLFIEEQLTFESNDEMLVSAALYTHRRRMIRPAKDLPFMMERPADADARTPIWKAQLANQIDALRGYFGGDWDPYATPVKIEDREL